MKRKWLTNLLYLSVIKSRDCALQPVCSAKLQGIVKVGAVDADQHKSLGGQYGVRGFPTIKIFGANKNKPEEYQGTNKTTPQRIPVAQIFEVFEFEKKKRSFSEKMNPKKLLLSELFRENRV